MITEIFIEGRKLDITADISSLITFAIDDVKDFASRQTAFSKTVVLPGTANNNAIFGNIFETGISNDYNPLLENIGYNFNPARSARCIIFQDNLQTFKGTIRLLEITHDKRGIEYEAALNGELTGLNVALSSGFLTDLDFTEYNLPWNFDNIVASWDNAPGSGATFPLIDYGNYSFNKKDWDFRTFRPALYVKEYIDKMFAAANFRLTCDLFNTDRFKRLVVPHNQKMLTKLTGSVLTGTKAIQQHIMDHFAGTMWGDVGFETLVGSLFIPSAGNSVFTYVGATTIDTVLNITVDGYWNYNTGTNLSAQIIIQKNGVNYYVDPSELKPDLGRDIHFSRTYSIPIILSTMDDIRLHFTFDPTSVFPDARVGHVYVDSATIGVSSTSGTITAPVDYNEEIDMKFAIPQNVRQVDFLVSIVKLFNLYVYESRFDERLILIAPFVDFYSAGSGASVDWTYKLNRDAPIRIKPLSEINSKIYHFNYRDDSDYYNDLYKKRYNQGYGSRIYDSEFEFASQTNKLELIFAPTPLVGYVGEDKIYSTIFKRTGTATLVEENVDSVIRILQTKKIGDVSSWEMKNITTVLGSQVSYGYAGHFDDPEHPDNDINFGAVKELFYQLNEGDLTKTQFNTYWSAYMAEITDKDSKMLIAKFYLTPADIFQLDFAKYVYVDGSLFRLNKITDYNATIPSDCQVELLKVIHTSYSFPPGAIPDIPPADVFLLWDDGEDLLWDDGQQILYA